MRDDYLDIGFQTAKIEDWFWQVQTWILKLFWNSITKIGVVILDLETVSVNFTIIRFYRNEINFNKRPNEFSVGIDCSAMTFSQRFDFVTSASESLCDEGKCAHLWMKQDFTNWGRTTVKPKANLMCSI